MVKYCIAKKTLLRKYKTKKSYSKNEEWLCIEGCPCIISFENDEYIILNSISSDFNRNLLVYKTEYNDFFIDIEPDKEGFLYVDKYPIPINVTEFDRRNDVNIIKSNITKLCYNSELSLQTKSIFKDKLFQIIQSQGAPYININDYKKFVKGEISLSKHKRFGNMIFNRNSRWCPPIDVTYEEYCLSPSYPAPLGIRPKDFCLPSELIDVIKELINQIVNFENFPKNDFNIIKNELNFISKKEYACNFCGNKLNYDEYSSAYKSEINFMEICHKDPKGRFTSDNVYWGHCRCNRMQGGFSENEIITAGLNLLFITKRIDNDLYIKLKNLV